MLLRNWSLFYVKQKPNRIKGLVDWEKRMFKYDCWLLKINISTCWIHNNIKTHVCFCFISISLSHAFPLIDFRLQHDLSCSILFPACFDHKQWFWFAIVWPVSLCLWTESRKKLQYVVTAIDTQHWNQFEEHDHSTASTIIQYTQHSLIDLHNMYTRGCVIPLWQ